MHFSFRGFYEALEWPEQSGFSYFALGAIIFFCFFNFVMYFQNKDKSYLLYGLYLFLIAFGHVRPHQQEMIGKFYHVDEYLMGIFIYATFWFYNIVYILFLIEFVNLKNSNYKKFKHIILSVRVLITLGLLLLGISFFMGNAVLLEQFYIVFYLPFMLAMSVYLFIAIYNIRSQLRTYALVGSFIFSVTSYGAIAISVFTQEKTMISLSVFYIGVLIENMFFALGLGYKQQLVGKEKNIAQKELIQQLEENQALKKSINKKLEFEINRVTQELETLMVVREREQAQKIESEFEQQISELKVDSLRSQMNPHFIFNTLNSIKLYIIDNQKENAVYFLNKFSKLIRKILNFSQRSTVSLEEELQTIELYLQMENIRFNNEIDYEIVIKENRNTAITKLPPLLLQPFVENAIWHGLSPLKNRSKKLRIVVASKKENFITISIIDNGIGREKAGQIKAKKIHKRKSLGIQITLDRLEVFARRCQKAYSFDVIDLKQDCNPMGTEVVIGIEM